MISRLIFVLILLTGLAPEALSANVKSGHIYVNQSDSLQIEQTISEALQLSRAGDYEGAVKLLNQADSLSRILNYSVGIEKVVSRRIDILIDRGRYDEAVEKAKQAIDEYPESHEISQYYNLLGTSYDYLEEPLLAIQNFEIALEIEQGSGSDADQNFIAGIYQNLAVVYKSLGEKAKALENFLLALETAQKTDQPQLLTVINNNLGLTYSDNDEFEKAIYYYEQSLELAEQINSKIDLYRGNLNLANTLSSMERYEEALARYEEADRLWSELRPNSPPVIIIHNRGKTLAQMGRYSEAEPLLLESLELSQQMGIQEGVYYNRYILGKMYIELGRAEEAVYNAEQALNLSLGSGNPTLISDSQNLLHQAYAQANRYEDAYQVLFDNKVHSDSISSLEKERELADLESRLEVTRQSDINRLLQEKQVQQETQLRNQFIIIVLAILFIALILITLFLMRKNSREKEKILSQLQTQKEELELLNEAKDKLFAIIAHDLRSPLTSMQGILYLIKDDLLSQEEVKALIPEIEGSLQQNMDVMEDLLAWAKEQLSGVKMEIEPVEVSPLVNDIVSSQAFLAEKKGITVNYDLSTELKILADKNALRLVVRNLVSNAIKYTKRGDKIDISSSQNNGNVQIEIKDTGIGIPESATDKIFKSKSWTREGTNNEKGTGFGLSLSKEFVERMNGRIWFESEVDKGSSFYIELPKHE